MTNNLQTCLANPGVRPAKSYQSRLESDPVFSGGNLINCGFCHPTGFHNPRLNNDSRLWYNKLSGMYLLLDEERGPFMVGYGNNIPEKELSGLIDDYTHKPGIMLPAILGSLGDLAGCQISTMTNSSTMGTLSAILFTGGLGVLSAYKIQGIIYRGRQARFIRSLEAIKNEMRGRYVLGSGTVKKEITRKPANVDDGTVRWVN